MTSSSNLRQGSVWKDKLFEMTNQEFKAQGTKYQVLPNFGICCRELRELKVANFCTCVRSFCFVGQINTAFISHVSLTAFAEWLHGSYKNCESQLKQIFETKATSR